MLVQRQTPKRLRKLLIGGGVALVPILGYIAYLNFFSSPPAAELAGTVVQKIVPADFGQQLFRDVRFNALAPKQGTALITQAVVTVPSESITIPEAVQLFDMQSGGTVLFTWKNPQTSQGATIVRVNTIDGTSSTNIATLPATATTYLYRDARDGVPTTYELHYVSQFGVVDSPALVARTGATGGTLTIAEATDDEVKLTWATPAGEFDAVEVYRSTTVGDLGMRLARLDVDDTSYTDLQGRSGMYFYLVRWVGSSISGLVAQGVVTSSDTETPAPPQATNSILVDKGVDSTVEQPFVRVTWSPSPSPDVASYEIFRSASAMSLGTKLSTKEVQGLATIEETARDPMIAKDCAEQYCYEDLSFNGSSAPLKGIPYYYTVVAVDAVGNRSSLQELDASRRANPFIPL